MENTEKSENTIMEYDEVSKSNTSVVQSYNVKEMPTKTSLDCTQMSPEASLEHSDGGFDDEKKHEVAPQKNLESHIDFDSEDSNACCPICLEDFVETEYVIVLPACKHYYHVGCIREWLLTKQGCCPLCKVDALFSDTESQGERPPMPLRNGSSLMAGHLQPSTSIEIQWSLKLPNWCAHDVDYIAAYHSIMFHCYASVFPFFLTRSKYRYNTTINGNTEKRKW
jgi:Ring finger domain